MKTLRLTRPWRHQGVTWPADQRLCLNDYTAGLALQEAPAETVTLPQHAPVLVRDPLPDGPGYWRMRMGFGPMRVLFVRAGGYGDLLVLRGVISRFKHHFPMSKVAVSTYPNYYEVFADTDIHLESYPLRYEDYMAYDVVFWLEDVAEWRPEGQTVPLGELMLSFTGLKETGVQPEYAVEEEEAEAALAALQPEGTPEKIQIGLQWAASVPERSWPLNGPFIRKAEFMEWEICLLGTHGPSYGWYGDGVRDLTEMGWTFRQSVAALMHCDVLVAPDSSLAHAAVATGTPLVSLFGPTKAELRINPGDYVRTIQAPDGQMLSIHPEEVIKKVEELLHATGAL